MQRQAEHVAAVTQAKIYEIGAKTMARLYTIDNVGISKNMQIELQKNKASRDRLAHQRNLLANGMSYRNL